VMASAFEVLSGAEPYQDVRGIAFRVPFPQIHVLTATFPRSTNRHPHLPRRTTRPTHTRPPSLDSDPTLPLAAASSSHRHRRYRNTSCYPPIRRVLHRHGRDGPVRSFIGRGRTRQVGVGRCRVDRRRTAAAAAATVQGRRFLHRRLLRAQQPAHPPVRPRPLHIVLHRRRFLLRPRPTDPREQYPPRRQQMLHPQLGDIKPRL
jgi:hypothetical protein